MLIVDVDGIVVSSIDGLDVVAVAAKIENVEIQEYVSFG